MYEEDKTEAVGLRKFGNLLGEKDPFDYTFWSVKFHYRNLRFVWKLLGE